MMDQIAGLENTYSVSQKILPPKVFWHFFPNGWKFSVQIYTLIMRSYLRWTTDFYPVTCNFDEVMPY